MFSGESLSTVLHALATGLPERARHMVLTSEELTDAERDLLTPIVGDESTDRAGQVRHIGDVLRERCGDRVLANECYRLAFYLSEDASRLSGNPLFAYFAAHRSGRLLDKWVHYFPIYQHHLDRFRGRAPSLLEIGVFQGGSLDMWEHYFGSSVQVVGIDIDPTAARLADPRSTVVIGDQADPDFLRSVVAEHGPFDIVIDDGGHTMSQQITSIETLFPTLRDGGVYIVEDCHTSYWNEYDGGRGRSGTFIEWAKERIDDLHGYHQPEPPHPVWTDHVDGIHCYDSVVAFHKRRRFAPFSEQVGSSDFVFLQRPTSDLVGEMLATRDTAVQQRDDERRRADELEAKVKQATTDLEIARNDLLDTWDQIRAMRQTASWRLTAPLRILRRRAREEG